MKSILSALALSTALSASPALAESAKVIQNTHDDIIKVCNDPDFWKYIVNSKGSICDEYSPDGGKNWFSIKTVGWASILALSLWAVVRIRKRGEEKWEEKIDPKPENNDWMVPFEKDDDLSHGETFPEKEWNEDDTITPEEQWSNSEELDIDPISEADVYMSYGRDADAEDILLDAIKKNPEKIETYTKLLELYHKTKNTAWFHKTFMNDDAVHVRNNLSENDLIQARAWGREIDPENPIYTELSTPTEKVIPIEEAPAVQEIMDLGPDTIVPEITEPTTEIVPPVEDIVIVHEEIKPSAVTISENILPVKVAEPENIPKKQQMMPWMDKPLSFQLQRRWFEVIKSPEQEKISIQVLREWSSLNILDKNEKVVQTIGYNEIFTIDNTIANTFLELPIGKKPRIRLEWRNGKTQHVEIIGHVEIKH